MKNETVVTLNESQLDSVIGKTIAEHIRLAQEKNTLNENWFSDATLQFGDFVYANAPQFFSVVLKLKNGYENGVDINDPAAMQLAKKVVGGLLMVPISVGSFFGTIVGGSKLLKKYEPQIEKLKGAFFSKVAGSGS